MWRWVTRGLVLSFVALLAPALLAQQVGFVGEVDSPDPSRPQSGMVLVRGWALDPNAISKVELYVDDQYQHDLVMNLPRLDLEEAHPDWPGIHTARPGFITGFSASRFTNGTHTVELRVYTSNGDVHFLGRRTIEINNSINQSPFGFLDNPTSAGVYNVSGAFPVGGWAADMDGVDHVEVLIDEGILQGAMYGGPRPDVGATFPDFPAAAFSGYVANIDSTRIQNGLHMLTIRVVDRLGMTATLGRRMIQVINNDNFLKPFGYLEEPQRDAVLYGTGCGENDSGPGPVSPPVVVGEHITPVRGWALDLGTRLDTGRVAYAELLVDGVRWISTDDCGVIEGEFANCYGLPRFDVQRFYPTFPDSPRSGFLFTLDVGALLKLGVRPGNHNLMVRVGDREQTFAELPNKDGIPVFFKCVDHNFDFPGFGYIEYPTSFAYLGGNVIFRGWALQELSSVTALQVMIDGNLAGYAQYGYPRPDVGVHYPHILNSSKSGWMFEMDTRKLTDARHRLTVVTVDSRGKTSEIGSVDFYVANGPKQP